MINKIAEALDFQAQAMVLRAKRQELIASNIANADTPHFKAQDVDFGTALRAATAAPNGQTPAGALKATAAGHISPAVVGSPAPALLYRLPAQPSIDGNTVDMDTERTLFADNAVRYEAAMRFLNGQIKTILTAIQG